MKLLKILPVLFLLVYYSYSSEYGTGLYFGYGTTVLSTKMASTLYGRWDFVYKEKLIIGGEFHAFISDDNQTIAEYFNNNNPESKMNYGGLSIGYYLLNKENYRVAATVLFGSGGFHSKNHVINEYNLENLLLIEPELFVEMNFTKNFAFGINPSYRIVKDRPEMEHISIRFYLKWGKY